MSKYSHQYVLVVLCFYELLDFLRYLNYLQVDLDFLVQQPVLVLIAWSKKQMEYHIKFTRQDTLEDKDSNGQHTYLKYIQL